MKCPNCGTDNPAGIKFCGECGSKLEKLCPECHQPVAANAKFCLNCGEFLSVDEEMPNAAPKPLWRTDSTNNNATPDLTQSIDLPTHMYDANMYQFDDDDTDFKLESPKARASIPARLSDLWKEYSELCETEIPEPKKDYTSPSLKSLPKEKQEKLDKAKQITNNPPGCFTGLYFLVLIPPIGGAIACVFLLIFCLLFQPSGDEIMKYFLASLPCAAVTWVLIMYLTVVRKRKKRYEEALDTLYMIEQEQKKIDEDNKAIQQKAAQLDKEFAAKMEAYEKQVNELTEAQDAKLEDLQVVACDDMDLLTIEITSENVLEIEESVMALFSILEEEIIPVRASWLFKHWDPAAVTADTEAAQTDKICMQKLHNSGSRILQATAIFCEAYKKTFIQKKMLQAGRLASPDYPDINKLLTNQLGQFEDQQEENFCQVLCKLLYSWQYEDEYYYVEKFANISLNKDFLYDLDSLGRRQNCQYYINIAQNFKLTYSDITGFLISAFCESITPRYNLISQLCDKSNELIDQCNANTTTTDSQLDSLAYEKAVAILSQQGYSGEYLHKKAREMSASLVAQNRSTYLSTASSPYVDVARKAGIRLTKKSYSSNLYENVNIGQYGSAFGIDQSIATTDDFLGIKPYIPRSMLLKHHLELLEEMDRILQQFKIHDNTIQSLLEDIPQTQKQRKQATNDMYCVGDVMVSEETFQEFLIAAREGKKLDAIKILRDATGMGLKEAKDCIEYFIEHELPYMS